MRLSRWARSAASLAVLTVSSHILCALTITNDVFAQDATAKNSMRRKAILRWKKTPDAIKWEFQLARNANMDPVIYRKTLSKTGIALKLKPGTYYFRVRGLDSEGDPGPWTSVQGFVVNASAPEPIEPKSNANFEYEKLEEKGILFKWAEGVSGSEYRLEVRDSEGTWLDRGVKKTEYYWRPQQGGDYEWRIGAETASGVEWSSYRKFKVEKTEKPKTVDKSVVPASDAQFWFIVRAAQGIFTQSGSDSFYNITDGSSFGLAGMYSTEFRWRLGSSENQRTLLSGSVNIELIRQSVDEEPFDIPRAYTRFFFTWRVGQRWRIGPLANFHGGKTGIFLLNPDTGQGLITTPTRFGVGFGGVAVYEAAPTLYMSLLAMGRYDFGGESYRIPQGLDPGFGFESGFGVVLALSKRWMLEGRLRVRNESLQWESEQAGQTGSFNSTYIVIDAGLGYRF